MLLFYSCYAFLFWSLFSNSSILWRRKDKYNWKQNRNQSPCFLFWFSTLSLLSLLGHTSLLHWSGAKCLLAEECYGIPAPLKPVAIQIVRNMHGNKTGEVWELGQVREVGTGWGMSHSTLVKPRLWWPPCCLWQPGRQCQNLHLSLLAQRLLFWQVSSSV